MEKEKRERMSCCSEYNLSNLLRLLLGNNNLPFNRVPPYGDSADFHYLPQVWVGAGRDDDPGCLCVAPLRGHVEQGLVLQLESL